MINLLPPKDKELLLLERNKKIVSILGMSAIAILICLWLILFSLKLHTLGEVDRQKSVAHNIETIHQTQDAKDVRNTIAQYNTMLAGVDRFYREQKSLHEALEQILEIHVPSGVWLTTLTIERSQKNNYAMVTIYGMSTTRENLVTFKNNIDKSSSVKNIVFPTSNWIKAKDISFSVTFHIEETSQ